MNQARTGLLDEADSGTADDPIRATNGVGPYAPGVQTIHISSLLPGDSPRSTGQSEEHITRLAELDEPLPPILVDRHSMRVIDGMHRLLATLLRGQERIEVEFFDGTPEDAFLRAVTANVTHGLPLSHADRKVAAARIIASHPHMSDRAIARASGLGTKTVAAIRRDSADPLTQVSARVGSDGRTRPLNRAEGRLRAAEVLARRPDASLREVARIAGISPATVSDVRKRLAVGELPVTDGSGTPGRREDGTEAGSGADAGAEQDLGHDAGRKLRRLEQVDPAPVLRKLLRDPSLRHNEDGRNLLRLLQQNAMTMSSELSVAVPAHCRELVVKLARQYADAWYDFARELDERTQTRTRKQA
ncbi:transcriptional regulator [Streptomyces sp. NPDC048171]